MTDKELTMAKIIIAATIGVLIGFSIGGEIATVRIDSEIRTDQLELKDQVAEIIEDDTKIKAIIDTLLFHVDQLKMERQEIRELKILLGKGE